MELSFLFVCVVIRKRRGEIEREKYINLRKKLLSLLHNHCPGEFVVFQCSIPLFKRFFIFKAAAIVYLTDKF